MLPFALFLLVIPNQTSPEGRVPVEAYPAATMIDTFARLCVGGEEDAARQEQLARADGFTLGKGPGSPPPGTFLQRKSIAFTLRDRGAYRHCVVSGMASESIALDRVGALVTSTLKVGQYEVGTVGSGQFARTVALWRPLKPASVSWAYVSVSPQSIVGQATSTTHIVLTLVTPIKAAE